MKTGIRGEWYLVHDQVWERAWPNSETTNSAKFFCSEILCVGCLEKRPRQATHARRFPAGMGHPKQLHEQTSAQSRIWHLTRRPAGRRGNATRAVRTAAIAAVIHVGHVAAGRHAAEA